METIAALVLIAATVAWARGSVATARRLSSIGWLMWIALILNHLPATEPEKG